MFEKYVFPTMKFLSDLRGSEKRALAKIMEVQYLNTGEAVFMQGDVGDRICFISEVTPPPPPPAPSLMWVIGSVSYQR